MKKYIKESLKYALRSNAIIKRYIDEVEALYAMTPKELHERNEQRFLEIFRKLWQSSDYYVDLCKLGGVSDISDIRSLNDITKLPILTKDMVKEHGEELLTCGKRWLVRNHTSGTTGTPLTVYEDWPALWREQAYLYCYRKRCGFTYGEPLVSLRGSLSRKDTSMMVHVSNTLFLSSYNINAETAATYHRLIERHHPKAIEGYPSSLYSLALVFKDKGMECSIPVAFTSSETFYDYQRKVIEEVFHTQVYDHYGTTERTISLDEDFGHNGYFESPGYGIEEYHDGYIISTSLINDAFPLIRYRQDDRIILKDNPSCKRSTDPTIERIDGRAIAYLIGKDGTEYSDSALTFIFKEARGVRFAQFVQTKKGETALNIVADDSFTDDSKSEILRLIDERCGLDNLKVSIRLISEDGLRLSRNHKLALVVSDTDIHA